MAAAVTNIATVIDTGMHKGIRKVSNSITIGI